MSGQLLTNQRQKKGQNLFGSGPAKRGGSIFTGPLIPVWIICRSGGDVRGLTVGSQGGYSQKTQPEQHGSARFRSEYGIGYITRIVETKGDSVPLCHFEIQCITPLVQCRSR